MNHNVIAGWVIPPLYCASFNERSNKYCCAHHPVCPFWMHIKRKRQIEPETFARTTLLDITNHFSIQYCILTLKGSKYSLSWHIIHEYNNCSCSTAFSFLWKLHSYPRFLNRFSVDAALSTPLVSDFVTTNYIGNFPNIVTNFLSNLGHHEWLIHVARL